MVFHVRLLIFGGPGCVVCVVLDSFQTPQIWVSQLISVPSWSQGVCGIVEKPNWAFTQYIRFSYSLPLFLWLISKALTKIWVNGTVTELSHQLTPNITRNTWICEVYKTYSMAHCIIKVCENFLIWLRHSPYKEVFAYLTNVKGFMKVLQAPQTIF